MSRTYNHRGYQRRFLKNSLYKKELGLFGEEFYHKRKDRKISRHLRSKLKRKSNKEIKEVSDE